MLQLVKKLLGGLGSKQPQRTAPRPAFRPSLEALESREVPAGVTGLTAMTPVLHNGVLTVVGNNSANTIDISLVNNRIKVLNKTFDPAQVKSISVDGQGGDDIIRISESIAKTTYLFGGFGNDTIQGGGGVDHIYGGGGRDSLYGRGSNDELYGGAGNDHLDGGAGSSDFAQGGGGSDTYANTNHGLDESSTSTIYSSSSINREIARLTNLERTKRGLAPLTFSAELNTVASGHAVTMRDLRVPMGTGISHAFSGNKLPTVGSRLDANLIEYTGYGENNFWSSSTTITAQQVVQGWMNSSGHRANILNANFTHIGIGSASSSSAGYYFTQVFATF